MTKWVVGDHRDVVLLTPRDHGVLDRARSQMIEDLITGGMAFAGTLPNIIEVGHIEVAHAPGEDLALALKLLEPRDRILKLGLPVLRALSLCTCCRHYPGAAAGRTHRSSHPAMSVRRASAGDNNPGGPS